VRPFEVQARQIVQYLLEEERVNRGLPVKIQTADGQVIDGDFNGYYDLREVGEGLYASIGYPDSQGGFSHGHLHPGDKLLTPIPSPEEWAAQNKPQPDPERDALLQQMHSRRI
jgi:hypothetical protein